MNTGNAPLRVSTELRSPEAVPAARSSRARIVESVAGIIAALVVFQFAASFFISPYLWVTPPLPISEDKPALPFHGVRQAAEGVSEALITDTGARFTGDFLPGAPVYVVIGDSHVLARNVNTAEAMGAVAQRLARAAGYRINIRELGRSGGAFVDYAVEAPAVLAQWHPVTVFVVISERDFEIPLLTSRLGTIERTPSGVRVIASPTPHIDSRSKRLYWRVRNLCTLTEVLFSSPLNLYDMFRENSRPSAIERKPAADPAPRRQEVETAVAGLKQAYGSKLVVVYHPETGITGGYVLDARETSILSACRDQDVPFLSVRAGMIAERDRNAHFSNGFLNGRPGAGHLNSWGHHVIGVALWQYIARRGSQ